MERGCYSLGKMKSSHDNVFLIFSLLLLVPFGCTASTNDRIVILTFDGSFKSHRTLVAPLLKELGLGATFFVNHPSNDPSNDQSDSLTWSEIAEIDQMGFEIGNRGWSCLDLSVPRNAARLLGDLALVEFELDKVEVPRPISFAYCQDSFGPEALGKLDSRGYRFGRRGVEPRPSSPGFDPTNHHPLSIPASGSVDSNWTEEGFNRLVNHASGESIVVLRFGAVGDANQAAPSITAESFRKFMNQLKEQRYMVAAMRDLDDRFSWQTEDQDPGLPSRHPEPQQGRLSLPEEMESTRDELAFWLKNMIRDHGYKWEEAAQVTGLSLDALQEEAEKLGLGELSANVPTGGLRILPYPGGRHPRIGHLEAAIDPMRGTKVSIFLPWEGAGYAVIDLPETFEAEGEQLIFLAHAHVPTIWNLQNQWLENVDWSRTSDGGVESERVLPNQVSFGSAARLDGEQVKLELWLKNGSTKTLKELRAAVCLMLKGAPDFNTQTKENKIFRCPVSAVRSAKGDRWILIAWDYCQVPGGNQDVPCLHADPVFEDCPPGEAVRAEGRVWFYEGEDIEGELEKSAGLFR